MRYEDSSSEVHSVSLRISRELLDALVAVDSQVTELFFDAEELVVLSHTVGTAERTGLDLTRVRSHSDVSDGSIFRFARAVRSNGGEAVTVSHIDRVKRFGERTDLVDLDQDGVTAAFSDTTTEVLYIRHEEVVTDELNLLTELVGELLPAFPVVLSPTVLKRIKRIHI